MRRTLLVWPLAVLLALSLSLSADAYFATCYGNDPCNACKDCKYCAHWAKQGGTCGVCKRLKVLTARGSDAIGAALPPQRMGQLPHLAGYVPASTGQVT